MTITTKYNPGEIVWLMFGFYETPETAEIKAIKLSVSTYGSMYIYYSFDNPYHRGEGKELFVKESEVFASEKELIEYKLSRVL